MGASVSTDTMELCNCLTSGMAGPESSGASAPSSSCDSAPASRTRRSPSKAVSNPQRRRRQRNLNGTKRRMTRGRGGGGGGGAAFPRPLALLLMSPHVSPTAAAGPDCWTHGFTRGQCCNGIFGHRGNSHCWDASQFTFDHCCDGKVFMPHSCSSFVTHFAWGSVGFRGTPEQMSEAWAQCADGMEDKPGFCNSANMTSGSCPECARLSPHLARYISCVKQEQERPAPGGSCPACRSEPVDEGGGSATIVGGEHFPTLIRPRAEGRDFTFLASAYDMTVGYQLISEGRWMPQETKLLRALLPIGGVAVDAGANIGGVTVPLSKHVGPQGQVHAFEPFRNIFQILTANCAMNGLVSCITYHNGLGNRPHRLERRSPGLNAVGNPSKSYIVEKVASEMLVHHDGSGRMEFIEVVRLDDKLDFLTRLDVIKIDVESSEYEMLQGAEQTIRRFQPAIYVEDSEADDLMGLQSPTKVQRLLADVHDYECINLPQAGLTTMTSLLCVPRARVQEVFRKVMSLDWNNLLE
mmetsp:Transcript_92321/g.202181  ORF Transcript_92321/g.202181 Transcript_92321/m.202181 type:complete len:523 (-) Transcript_92321:19-1587(-)